jgi:glycosyltransferase involved in cell wall biosynthesis
VGKVAKEFVINDNRIKYYRQSENKGPSYNFKYVLEKATGEYFMWASDDDEWTKDFVAQCLEVLQQKKAISVMSHFEVSYRFDGRKEEGILPDLGVDKTKFENALAFLDCMTPSLFYGVHRRESICFFLKDKFHDFYDCYFMLRLILMGRVAVIKPCIYTAGIDAPSYQLKPTKKHRFTRLQYSPLLFNGIQQILSSSMKVHEKFIVVSKLTYVVLRLFFFHEIKRMFL